MASVEPMTLGSPSSPPGAHGMSPYLHAYLMGEPAAASPSPSMRLWSGSTAPPSPQKSFNSSSVANTPLAFAAPPGGQSGQQQRAASDPHARDLSGRRSDKDKCGAPPVHGLMESIASPCVANDSLFETSAHVTQFPGVSAYTPTAHNTPDSLHHSVLEKSLHGQLLFGAPQKTPCSPAQIDPFYTQGEMIHPGDVLDDTWVTVFGFPPAATSFIVQQFAQYGSIVKHVVATEGNWMHVHYESRIQAKKALSKTGRVFGRGIMVGVLPCIDQKVMSSAASSDGDCAMRTSFLGTPSRSVHQGPSSAGTPGSPAIRPLTAAYRAAAAENEVVSRRANTPHKNSGVISQAMEYMFGW